jgi:alkanesulfonate monooxygenase SsuD/methylene tetrahydromethanopterin reductase-like flavin-dependent oxidoreductase (luciferase family)
MPPMLIGLGLSTSPGPGVDPLAEARAAEELGFDYVSASDHLNGTTPTYEPWTLLTTVLAATSRIRVLTRVLAIPYRHPAVLAKMAETLDRLSDGRLILGLGGGYVDEEFRAFGLPVPTNRDKVDGVAEQIAVARAIWSEPAASYEARLYRIEEAIVEPKPEHLIPIWLGMYRPRGLALTGREADGWIPSLNFAPPNVVAGLWEQVQAAAREAGREPSSITASYNLMIRIGEEMPGQATTLAGPAASVVEQLLGFTRLGFTSFNLVPAGPGRMEQIERLGRDVLPELRGAGAVAGTAG